MEVPAMRHRVTALLVLLGLPLLAVGIATPASAQVAPALTLSSGTLVARGAAVDFTVTATCEAGATAYIHLAVTERSGNRIAKGFGSTDGFTCNRGKRRVRAHVRDGGRDRPDHRVTCAVE
jgi:hypothetical protein